MQKNKLKAVFELCKRLNKKNNLRRISCPEDVIDCLYDMKFLKQEVFKVLLLDTKCQLIGIEEISKGTLDSSLVHPREVFKPAIKKSAKFIILVHNHPSGIIAPSKADIKITERLVEVGKILEIEVLDHVIIGDGFMSLKEMHYI